MIKVIFLYAILSGEAQAMTVPTIELCLEAKKDLLAEGIKADCKEVFFFANEA